MLRIKSFLVLFCCFILAHPVYGATWFISPLGSDLNAGTSIGAPFLTIAKGLLSASSTDVLALRSDGSGTYVITTPLVITQANIKIQGFQNTVGDGGTRPLITLATNSIDMFTTSSTTAGDQIFDNISMSNTAGTRGYGIVQLSGHGTSQWWTFKHCILDGFITGIASDNVGAHFTVSQIAVINTEIKNSTNTSSTLGSAITTDRGNLWISGGSYFHGGASSSSYQVYSAGTTGITTIFVDRTIFGSDAGGGIFFGGTSAFGHIDNSTFSGLAALKAVSLGANAVPITNSVFDTNNAGVVATSGNPATASAVASHNNSFRLSPNTNFAAGDGDVAPSVTPFTNSAGGDYSLNSVVGGGLLLKGAGLPGVFPGGTSTGALDIGAVQSVPTTVGVGSYVN